MAAIEKLLKALETLRVFQAAILADDASAKTKKEPLLNKKDKIASCNTIAECVCSQNLGSAADFPKFLGVAMETLITLCDDGDVDVRIVADECLNRLIRVLMKSGVGRLQVELYKEIKKNGPVRCVRAALWRFAELAHLILPQKCRPYIVNLLPCLLRISQRPEEMIQESLAGAMAKICPALVHFMNDLETKMLLKTFISNLKSEVVTVRRTAAQCIALICQHSHRPALFTVWTLRVLLESVRTRPRENVGVPPNSSIGGSGNVGVGGVSNNLAVGASETPDENVYNVLGVLLAIRQLMPVLDTTCDGYRQKLMNSGVKSAEPDVHVDVILTFKILELLLYYCKHADHNVITASLEAFHQLLKHAPKSLRLALVTSGKAHPTSSSPSPGHRRLPSVSDDVAMSDPDDTKYDVSVSEDQVVDLSQSRDNSSLATLSTGVPGPVAVNSEPCTQVEGQAANLDDTDDEEDNEIFDSLDQQPVEQSFISSVTADNQYSNMTVGDGSVIEGGMSASNSLEALPSCVGGDLPDAERHEMRLPSGAEESGLATSSDADDAFQHATVEADEIAQVGGSAAVLRRPGDIGSLTDGDSVPAVYIARLLCSEFLLTGYHCGLIPDRTVRVSVRTLALMCLACVVELHPKCLIVKLHKSSSEPGELQDMLDVIQYTSHSDPGLKGNAAILIGQFIKAVIVEGRGSWNDWLNVNGSGAADRCSLSDLMSHLIGQLTDESAVAVRLTLLALKLCLPVLSNSSHSDQAFKILLSVVQLKGNSYWLVKVALLELLSEVDFKDIVYLESLGIGSSSDNVQSRHRSLAKVDIQQLVLCDVILKLLGDEDHRVRKAAAAALCRLIPNMYCAVDTTLTDPVIIKAMSFTTSSLDFGHNDDSSSASRNTAVTFSNTVSPFDDIPSANSNAYGPVDAALSRVICEVVKAMAQSTNKFSTLGCCHALSELSNAYSVLQHTGVWGCSQLAALPSTSASTVLGALKARKIGRSLSGSSNVSAGSTSSATEEIAVHVGTSGGGPLSLVLALLTSSPVTLDLGAQVDLLQLSGNLMAGAAYKCLRSPDDVSSDEQLHWPALSDRLLASMANQLMTHLVRLLNICSHVIDDVIPGPPPNKTTLPSLASAAPSLSPIRRKTLKGAGKDDSTSTQGTPVKEKSSIRNTIKEAVSKDSDGTKDVKLRKEGVGLFYTIPHYMKLYEVVRGAYANHKISLDLGSTTDKFLLIVTVTLKVLAQLLELACLTDVAKVAEELLGYLGSTVGPEPTETILCVQQLLKAIFGSNLAGQWESSTSVPSSPYKVSSTKSSGRTSNATMKSGIYHSCLNQPYIHFTQSLAAASCRSMATNATSGGGSATASEIHDDSPGLMSWLKRRTEKKPASSTKSKTSTAADKTSVASYIRLFEPLVIKSLKQYTVSSQVTLQQRVLDLLSNLVQLRVNYCLLDSDQIFIGYVIKQFEYIEEGQMRNSDQLIPHIFNFLVLLSYERYHTKTIIQMPKIIQLCDGIMASGQDPATHAIPALQSIVYDLFIVRVANKANLGKELETQQEVVISMLLRLLHYYQVIDLLVLVLHQSRKESEDRWKRLSRQIVDLLLPLLSQLKVNVDSPVALNIVHKLLESVAPSVFRPIDILLKVLFSKPPKLSTEVELERWVSLVLISLRVILTQSKEEAVLGRLQQLALPISLAEIIPPCLLNDASNAQTVVAIANSDIRASSNTEEIFASFLLQVINVVVIELSNSAFNGVSSAASDMHGFLSVELSHLLLYITHMFQSGVCRRIAVASMGIIRQNTAVNLPHLFNLDVVNEKFQTISIKWPTLLIQWSNVLTLLNYGNKIYWSNLLQTPVSLPAHSGTVRCGVLHCPSLTSEIVRRGSLILFCDYVCENLTDAEHMTWLIINHVFDLIFLLSEPPVQDFMSAVNRNAAASGLFIQAVHSQSEYLSKLPMVLIQRALQCLSGVNNAQSGALVSLLVECFLDTHHLILAHTADNLACRRIELMIADCAENGMNQLSVDEITKLLHIMNKRQLVDRHSRLAALLQKLRGVLSADAQQQQNAEKHQPSVGDFDNIDVNKDWYVTVVNELCCRHKAEAKLCAQLLQHMDYTNILSVVMNKNCHLSVLRECIALGVKRTVRLTLAQSPVSPRHTDVSESTAALDPLLRAAELTLLRRINSIINTLPVPHQVLHFPSPKGVSHYQEHLDELFMDGPCLHTITHLSDALYSYLMALETLPWSRDIPNESVRDVARFATLSLEALCWMLTHDRLPTSSHLVTNLRCYAVVVYNQHMVALLSEREQTSLVCSAIHTVHTLVFSLLVVQSDRLVRLPEQESQDDLPNSSFDDCHHAIRACDQISELIDCLSTLFSPQSYRFESLPLYVVQPLVTVIIGLARLPLVNSYARTPVAVWKLGWMPSPTGAMRTKLPPLPLEYLREKDILSDFIHRVNALGWTSRQQFEETWMSLLGVLNPLPVESPQSAPSPDELVERLQCQVLAIRGITSLLLQTMLTPQCGCPGNSSYEFQPRNRTLAFFMTRNGKRLAEVRGLVEKELCQMIELHKKLSVSESGGHQVDWRTLLTENVERLNASSRGCFQMGQLSVESLWLWLGVMDTVTLPSMHSLSSDSGASSDVTAFDMADPALLELSSPVAGGRKVPMERSSKQCDLDINSCLQLLLDVYGNTILSTISSVPLAVLNETVRSIIVLSDVFTDKSQFEWMLTTLFEIQKSHPVEDELITQYLAVGISKAAAVVGIETGQAEKIVKFVDSCMKSTHLSTKIAALYGSVYLLAIGQCEVNTSLIQLLSEMLLRSLAGITPMTIHSQQHALIMWSVAFYIAENFGTELHEVDFANKLVQLSMSVVSADEEATSIAVYRAVMASLERLVINDCLLEKPLLERRTIDAIVKLSIDRLCQPNPQRSLAALGLFVSCMYSDLAGHRVASDDAVAGENADQGMVSHGAVALYNPEDLIEAMERVMVLFDRIRKGFPYEARVITRILPEFLTDFFPPQDIMNKVIAEFLSSQQAHPELMANVLFQVFESLINARQVTLMHNWVILSLSNFTQRTPLSFAIWSLTCLFISASTNQWLRALMPMMINRVGGQLEYIDNQLFCLAARDFYSQLHYDQSHQRAFRSTFQSVASPDTPYSAVLTFCGAQ